MDEKTDRKWFDMPPNVRLGLLEIFQPTIRRRQKWSVNIPGNYKRLLAEKGFIENDTLTKEARELAKMYKDDPRDNFWKYGKD